MQDTRQQGGYDNWRSRDRGGRVSPSRNQYQSRELSPRGGRAESPGQGESRQIVDQHQRKGKEMEGVRRLPESDSVGQTSSPLN